MEYKVVMADLFRNVREGMQKIDMGSKAIINMEGAALRPLERYFENRKCLYYDKNLCNNFLEDYERRYKNGDFGRSKIICIRKAIVLFEECAQSGTVEWHCSKNRNVRKIAPYFSSTFDDYITSQTNAKQLCSSTIKVYASAIKQFLHYLEDCGCETFTSVTRCLVNSFIPQCSKKYPRGLATVLPAVRSFLVFLNKKNILTQDLSETLNTITSPRRIIRPGFDRDEADLLLSVINRSTVLGKRDYAITLLAVRTGLRAIDITNLRFSDINWYRNEIRVIQHKTGKVLVLPLFPDSGNAIADYLLNGRPKTKSDFIFLRAVHPYIKLADRSVSGIATRYLIKAGIDRTITVRRGFHSFRRSVGKWLLEAEIPLETIREILGHRHPNSLKPYLSIDHKHLENCALGLEGIEIVREELL